MNQIMKLLKKYYFLFIFLWFFGMRFGYFDIWSTNNLFIRVISIPLMILIIYLSFIDLFEKEDMSIDRFRWMAFDVLIIIVSIFTIFQSIYVIIIQIKSII